MYIFVPLFTFYWGIVSVEDLSPQPQISFYSMTECNEWAEEKKRRMLEEEGGRSSSIKIRCALFKVL